ncbi:hypothetical protein DXG03_007308, partial [Asterophora parasitica]
MPGKHVRFSSVATVHSPPTPALSFSTFSPASSSSAPLTPPSYSLPGPSPYMVPPRSQAQRMASVRIHAFLQSSSSPALNFDLTLPPSTITFHHKGISLREFSEPATSPPLPVLTIIIPHLPWTATVRPSHRDGAFVTVSDVLEEIYRKL